MKKGGPGAALRHSACAPASVPAVAPLLVLAVLGHARLTPRAVTLLSGLVLLAGARLLLLLLLTLLLVVLLIGHGLLRCDGASLASGDQPSAS